MKKTTSHRPNDLPAGPDIDKWEQIDSSRREVLLKLCSSKVAALYKTLLSQASIEYNAEQGMVAVLTCSTIRALARALRKSYDFLLRCVSIFKALGLMHHVPNRNHGTRLSIPLGCYLPLSSLTTLNNLITGTRNKLSRLARQTKNLYIQHYGDPDPHHSYPSTIQQLKAACEQLLQGPLNQESIQLLYARVGTMVACFQNPAQPGDPSASMGDPTTPIHQQHPQAQGDPSPSVGDLSTLNGRTGLPEGEDPSQQMGDSSTNIGDPSQQLGDSSTKMGDPSPQKGDFSIKMGDLYVPKQDFFSPIELEEGKKGEKRETQVSPISIIDIVDNNNIINLSNFNDNVIDRQPERSPQSETMAGCQTRAERLRSEAMALALFVENSPRNVASFIHKLANNPQATRAAVIDLLIQTYMPDYRGKPRNRGAWLNKAYTHYAAPHVLIPPMVKRWLYTHESWQEIEQALMQETEQQQEQRPPTDAEASVPRERETDPALPAVPCRDRSKNWLDQLDAVQLAQQIVQDGAEHGYMLKTEIVPDQAVWLVRVRWGEHQLDIRSWAHWRGEFAEIHAMLQARKRLPE
ncbi:hypothetical protein [Dictyobacter aurantiacus]|uniref:Uncharacterized protein n=1 Tax=Dictyobacter aurantiacus TaxID=1936993 RepID=A0A401ZN61_9CHLR|nr:hypothetical protein [Dictyobacter aurantiacus]GCE08196.1 hypothetical protein KDAU_55250 [Dictyobacter aurantiacus]